MSILILAEHENGQLKPNTLNVITAAQKLGGDITVLVAGHQVEAVAKQAAAVEGVGKVLHADHEKLAHPLAEPLADLLKALADGVSYFVAPASTFGKNVMPRLAAFLDTQQISDITGVEAGDTFIRPIYAGNAFATVKSSDAVKVITVRPTAFDAVAASGGSASVEAVDAGKIDAALGSTVASSYVGLEGSGGERPDLGSARVVVSGGRGVGSGENFKLIEALADKLGGAVGASRAAVDAGYVPNDYQVGQTGKVVAPELYIAVGISGAIQHLAGMSESKVIVAINKDEEAPITQIADYTLVADLFDAVPELTEKL